MEELTWYDLMWCARRLPRDLKDMMKREGPRVFVAGGFIRSCIANETVNDIDVFTSTKEDAERLAYELASGEPVPESMRPNPGYGLPKGGMVRKPYTTDNAYTVTARRVSVQFIHRWSFKQPEDAIASFDFTIAKAAIWWNTGNPGYTGDNIAGWRSTCEESFYADLAAKRLVYTSPVRNEDAGGSLLRVLKFYQRGYRIPMDSMGAVIARLVQGVDFGQFNTGLLRKDLGQERALAKVLTGLLREVDPLVDPDAEGHVDTLHDAEGQPVDTMPGEEQCPI